MEEFRDLLSKGLGANSETVCIFWASVYVQYLKRLINLLRFIFVFQSPGFFLRENVNV